MDTPVLTDQQKFTFIETECCLENLPRVMTDRDGWPERVK